MPKIDLSTNRIAYKFEIQGKYSLICGDSATGKSTLCDLVQVANRTNAGVINKSDAKLLVLTDNVNVINPENLRNYVVFVDEDAPVLKMSGYEEWMKQCECYFVIITRTLKLRNLPISVDSVYTVHSSGKYHTLKPINARFGEQTLKTVDAVIVEDSNSGFDFFKQLLTLAKVNHAILCESAKGNARIVKKLEDTIASGYKNIVVVYDAAGMGALIRELKIFINAHPSCTFFIVDWESFEHYILASAVFNKHYTLQDAGCQYESLEQYSTARLEEQMPNYNKQRLPHCLQCGGCIKCYDRKDCVCANYDFSKYVYGNVKTVYTVAKNKTVKPLAGISGVTYTYFLQSAQAYRRSAKQLWHIDATDFAHNKCKIANNNVVYEVNITDLVMKTLRGEICLTNPSALKSWKGFVD